MIGTEEEIEAKLRELAELGVTEFNIYPYIPNLLETIDVYGRRDRAEDQLRDLRH